MYNIVELEQQRQHKALTMKEIVDRAEKAPGGPRPMNEEEIKLFDDTKEEVGRLDANIKLVRATMERAEQRDALIRDLETPRKIAEPNPVRKETTSAFVRIPAEARRTGPLVAFKLQAGETTEERDMRAYRAGLWVQATVFRNERAAHKCAQLGMDIRNAMSTGSNPDGGFLVPEEMSRAIIDLRETYGVARQNARVWPMGSDTLDIPRRAGGVTIAALGENPASGYSQSSPTFNLVKLVAKKFGGLTLLSSEIAEDAVIDLADWIAQEFAYGFALFEDTAFFNGDATSTYQGIRGLSKLLLASSSLKGAVNAASTHDTMAEIDYIDIATLMAALPQYAKPRAKFYCSSVFLELVFNRIKANAGGNTIPILGEAPGNNYLGYPIVVSQVLETSTGTINGTPYCFFGDLTKSSALGDRRQTRIKRSDERFIDTDQIAILGTERIDIVHNDIGDANTAGPVVALNGKT